MAMVLLDKLMSRDTRSGDCGGLVLVQGGYGASEGCEGRHRAEICQARRSFALQTLKS
jgi:hypothetical protein